MVRMPGISLGDFAPTASKASAPSGPTSVRLLAMAGVSAGGTVLNSIGVAVGNARMGNGQYRVSLLTPAPEGATATAFSLGQQRALSADLVDNLVSVRAPSDTAFLVFVTAPVTTASPQPAPEVTHGD